jgi:hypothetical protein
MNWPFSLTPSGATKIMIGVAAFAAASGVAFAAWAEHGASIFMTMVESGLSWCF